MRPVVEKKQPVMARFAGQLRVSGIAASHGGKTDAKRCKTSTELDRETAEVHIFCVILWHGGVDLHEPPVSNRCGAFGCGAEFQMESASHHGRTSSCRRQDPLLSSFGVLG